MMIIAPITGCAIDFSQSHGVSSDDLRIALQEENIESRPLWHAHATYIC
jgi:hypothetical protein